MVEKKSPSGPTVVGKEPAAENERASQKPEGSEGAIAQVSLRITPSCYKTTANSVIQPGTEQKQDGEAEGNDAPVTMANSRGDESQDKPLGENQIQDSQGQDVSDNQPNVGADNANTSFPPASFGGSSDLNQMQMMMMQNGMNPAAFGNFSMMGKSYRATLPRSRV